ncbi:MAG: TrkH family potassium uptake protein, partial [Tissierellaceae bacterium]
MNYGIVLKVLGSILMVESIFMLPSLVISIYTKQGDLYGFLTTIVVTLALGLILALKKNKGKSINAKEGLAIVSIGWLLVSLFGALPLYISGSTRTYIDAVFEIVSGFT